jgi:hypothetical protein
MPTVGDLAQSTTRRVEIAGGGPTRFEVTAHHWRPLKRIVYSARPASARRPSHPEPVRRRGSGDEKYQPMGVSRLAQRTFPLKVSAPEEIRTPNLLIRSQMLYPLSYGRMSLVV